MKTRSSVPITALGGYPLAAAAVLLTAVLLLPLRTLLEPPAIMLMFVPVIIGLARVLGVVPSTAAAVLAFLALDFLFIPPYYRFAVGSLSAWIALVVFLIVALAAGQQTGRLRERERGAVQRQEELELLNRLSFRIATARSPEDIAEFVARQVTAALGARRAALYLPGGSANAPRCIASAGLGAESSGEGALAGWVVRHGIAVGLPGDGVDGYRGPRSVGPDEAVPGVTAEGVYVPLQTADSLEGVLHAAPPVEGRDAIDPSLLVAVANLVAASLERRRLEEDASHAETLREADRLKTTLVSSVSHELKTPLAAATARVTGLIDEGAADPLRVREELGEVASDLGRLNASIGDLLDLSRLESDSWRPKRAMHELGDVLAAVSARLPESQRGRIRYALSASAPFVYGDFTQLVRAFVNVVENGLAYSPSGSPVIVSSVAKGSDIVVAVEDRGPGVAAAERERVFEKFFRGSAAASAPAGTGLGLAIALEIVRSHDGRLWVEDVQPSGARFVVALPAGGWAERR